MWLSIMKIIADSYRSTVRTVKVLYRTASFVSLALVLTTAFTTQHSGYLQLTAPFGTAVATADATKLAQEAVSYQKETERRQKVATSTQLPQEKPKVR